MRLYRAAGGRDPEALAGSLKAGDAATLLRQLKSKANQAIAKGLGGRANAAPYLIQGVGTYQKKHGIALDKGLITVHDAP